MTSERKAVLLENISEVSKPIFESNGIECEILPGALSEDELIEKLQGVKFLGLRSATNLTRKVFENCPDLVAAGAYSIGTNQIDLEAASEYGVAVFNAPFSNGRSVVELIIGEIVALYRHLSDRNRSLQAGIWDKTASGSFEVRGKTLGIVGYGKIGTQLSVLAEAMGLRVLFYDILERPALGNAKAVASLSELLEQSDIVTLHVDGRDDNRGFFGESDFEKMRPGSLFLNASRGFVVDYDALKSHLESGQIAGAAIDVYEKEPKKRGDKFTHILQGIDNVILTPHIGGSTLEAQRSIGDFVSHKLVDYYKMGSTALSVNMPNIQLVPTTSKARIMHIHKNVPGVLMQVNQILSEEGANIEAQWLSTRGKIGYVVTDLNSEVPEHLKERLRTFGETIYVRGQ
ncbi:MAG: phosphoglycerate dehydrogenase [Candidatus Ancillula sp.]|jgi:D-3-phosphoglycerate dehydrogenase|nr:phosphoglycerate dehydrogenase [Candidatus Ancillula sp.]